MAGKFSKDINSSLKNCVHNSCHEMHKKRNKHTDETTPKRKHKTHKTEGNFSKINNPEEGDCDTKHHHKHKSEEVTHKSHSRKRHHSVQSTESHHKSPEVLPKAKTFIKHKSRSDKNSLETTKNKVSQIWYCQVETNSPFKQSKKELETETKRKHKNLKERATSTHSPDKHLLNVLSPDVDKSRIHHFKDPKLTTVIKPKIHHHKPSKKDIDVDKKIEEGLKMYFNKLQNLIDKKFESIQKRHTRKKDIEDRYRNIPHNRKETIKNPFVDDNGMIKHRKNVEKFLQTLPETKSRHKHRRHRSHPTPPSYQEAKTKTATIKKRNNAETQVNFDFYFYDKHSSKYVNLYDNTDSLYRCKDENHFWVEGIEPANKDTATKARKRKLVPNLECKTVSIVGIPPQPKNITVPIEEILEKKNRLRRFKLYYQYSLDNNQITPSGSDTGDRYVPSESLKVLSDNSEGNEPVNYNNIKEKPIRDLPQRNDTLTSKSDMDISYSCLIKAKRHNISVEDLTVKEFYNNIDYFKRSFEKQTPENCFTNFQVMQFLENMHELYLASQKIVPTIENTENKSIEVISTYPRTDQMTSYQDIVKVDDVQIYQQKDYVEDKSVFQLPTMRNRHLDINEKKPKNSQAKKFTSSSVVGEENNDNRCILSPDVETLDDNTGRCFSKDVRTSTNLSSLTKIRSTSSKPVENYNLSKLNVATNKTDNGLDDETINRYQPRSISSKNVAIKEVETNLINDYNDDVSQKQLSSKKSAFKDVQTVSNWESGESGLNRTQKRKSSKKSDPITVSNDNSDDDTLDRSKKRYNSAFEDDGTGENVDYDEDRVQKYIPTKHSSSKDARMCLNVNSNDDTFDRSKKRYNSDFKDDGRVEIVNYDDDRPQKRISCKNFNSRDAVTVLNDNSDDDTFKSSKKRYNSDFKDDGRVENVDYDEDRLQKRISCKNFNSKDAVTVSNDNSDDDTFDRSKKRHNSSKNVALKQDKTVKNVEYDEVRAQKRISDKNSSSKDARTVNSDDETLDRSKKRYIASKNSAFKDERTVKNVDYDEDRRISTKNFNSRDSKTVNSDDETLDRSQKRCKSSKKSAFKDSNADSDDDTLDRSPKRCISSKNSAKDARANTVDKRYNSTVYKDVEVESDVDRVQIRKNSDTLSRGQKKCYLSKSPAIKDIKTFDSDEETLKKNDKRSSKKSSIANEDTNHPRVLKHCDLAKTIKDTIPKQLLKSKSKTKSKKPPSKKDDMSTLPTIQEHKRRPHSASSTSGHHSDFKIKKSQSEINFERNLLTDRSQIKAHSLDRYLMSNKSLTNDHIYCSRLMVTKDYRTSKVSSYQKRKKYDETIRKKMKKKLSLQDKNQIYEVRYLTLNQAKRLPERHDLCENGNEFINFFNYICNSIKSKCNESIGDPKDDVKEYTSCPIIPTNDSSFDFLYQEDEIQKPLNPILGFSLNDQMESPASETSGYDSSRSRHSFSFLNFFKKPKLAALLKPQLERSNSDLQLGISTSAPYSKTPKNVVVKKFASDTNLLSTDLNLQPLSAKDSDRYISLLERIVDSDIYLTNLSSCSITLVDSDESFKTVRSFRNKTYSSSEIKRLIAKKFFENILEMYEKEAALSSGLFKDEDFIENQLTLAVKKLKRPLSCRIKNAFKKVFGRKKTAVIEVGDKPEIIDNEYQKKLQALAHSAHKYFSMLVQAVAVNNKMDDEMKMYGILRLLEAIEKGQFTFLKKFASGHERTDLETEIRDQVKKTFIDVYSSAKDEASKHRRKLSVNDVKLICAFVCKYRIGLLSRTDIVATYLGKGFFQNENQLKVAVTYLLKSTTKVDLQDFEEFCRNNFINYC